jgi:stage II sporulation protein D
MALGRLVRLHFLLSVALISIQSPGAAEASLPIRVLLLRASPFAQVSTGGSLRVYSLAEGRLLSTIRGGGSFRLRAKGTKILLSRDAKVTLPPGGVRLRAMGGVIRLNGAPYRGTLDVLASEGRLWVVNTVRLEDYLRGVVGREIPPTWPLAALKAQAVAARTFSLMIRERSERAAPERPFFHVTAGTQDQVYGGISAEDPAIDEAVLSTAGQILAYRGQIAWTFFHAASGGHTEAARAVWPTIDAPYIRGMPVPAESKEPSQNWEAWVRLSELRASLARVGRSLGPIRDVRIVGRTASGRAAKVRIDHRNGRVRIPATQLRRALGYKRIRSTLFTVRRRRGSLVFRGRGYGHGVGMSQQGARLLAEAGMRYDHILSYYYPGTSLKRAEEAAFPDEVFLAQQKIDDLSLLLR